MSYQNVLAKMVEKSGLTLKELSEKCKDFGVKIDPSYISKLQTGKQPPASDEVNIAIARACEVHPGELLYEGYMVKAPELINNFISSVLGYFRDEEKTKIINLTKSDGDKRRFFEETIDNQTDYDLVSELLESNLAITRSNKNKYPNKDNHKIHSEQIKQTSYFVTMNDDSLTPVIPKGVKIEIESNENISNGDFVIAMFNNEDRVIYRRYIEIDNSVILVAENKDYKPIKIEDDNVTIFGRIKSFTTSV